MDGKSSKMAISCCVIYSLPSGPVKVSQTTLDNLVEILKNLHPPTLICVGHFLSFSQRMTFIQIQVAVLLLMGGTQHNYPSGIQACLLSMVTDHEQLHCSTDLLFQEIKVHIS